MESKSIQINDSRLASKIHTGIARFFYLSTSTIHIAFYEHTHLF